MALTSTALEAMFSSPPVVTEPPARAAMADGFRSYMAGSTVAGSTAVNAQLQVPRDSMEAALTGMSTSGAGAALIQAGIVAFWAACGPLAPSIWVTVPVIVPASLIVPPSLGTIAAALTSVFTANTAGSLSLSASATALAIILHPLNLGATVTLAPPPVGGTPGVPVL